MNIKGMLAGLVMAGSAAAMMGCNQPLASTSDPTDVAASTDEGAAPQIADWFAVRTGWGRPVVARPVVGAYFHTGFARFAPPAARVEVVGRAPSYRHFWSPGYYRWSGARYTWVGGNWMLRRPGLRYVAGHYDRIGGFYHWVPAHWVR
jgi:hypothetical protein